MTQTSEVKRASKGRFAKGVSGNPSGRPKQASTLLREQLKEHGAEVAQKVIDSALQGDMQAAKMVLDRLAPPLKAQAAPVTIDLPEAAGLAGTAKAVIASAASGELAPDIAAQMVAAVGQLARISEIDELLKRVERLEKVTDSGGHEW